MTGGDGGNTAMAHPSLGQEERKTGRGTEGRRGRLKAVRTTSGPHESQNIRAIITAGIDDAGIGTIVKKKKTGHVEIRIQGADTDGGNHIPDPFLGHGRHLLAQDIRNSPNTGASLVLHDALREAQ